jgi:hypothetical protein
MGEKKAKWLEHLLAAESTGQKLSAYAAQHQIDVHRLYEAKRKRPQQATSNWAVVRVKPDPSAQVTPKARECVAPPTVAMQARLGNGVVLSWAHDQRNADAPSSVLRTLAALPCFI